MRYWAELVRDLRHAERDAGALLRACIVCVLRAEDVGSYLVLRGVEDRLRLERDYAVLSRVTAQALARKSLGVSFSPDNHGG